MLMLRTACMNLCVMIITIDVFVYRVNLEHVFARYRNASLASHQNMFDLYKHFNVTQPAIMKPVECLGLTESNYSTFTRISFGMCLIREES